MSVKPETTLGKHVMDRLKAEGGMWFKTHGGAFQIVGLPDIVGCYKGRFISMELKQPGKEPTLIQWKRILAIKKVGGRSWYCTNVAEAIAIRDGINFTVGD